MKGIKLIIAIFFLLPILSIASPSLSGEKDPCSQAKRDYLAAHQDWSSINAELSFMRGEIERLRGLRWELRIILSVVTDALKITKEKRSLTDAQRIALNARIPNNRGTIDPDATFTTDLLGTVPLKLDEAKGMLKRLIVRSEEHIKKTEKELKDQEGKSHLLSQRLTDLEELVEKECKAVGMVTPWEQGLPRMAGRDIAQRYIEKEQLRQEEVESRRQADLERFWVKKHYPFPFYPRYPYAPYYHYAGYRPNAMLIELKSADSHRSCLQCYPFSSSWEKRWVLDELERAARNHDHMPYVGTLGAYKVIEVYDNISQCYYRLY
ncbi:MAG TPA: hypothetical protein ENF70_04715 [Deltaproteobacteria bacterium]|nr:hypothetical protein [Deltaproteobacteria bacterium]